MAADPLHGITLEALLKELVAAYGFEELARRVPIRCFAHEPSVSSSLKFLRRTPWARARVEGLYLFHLREQRRQQKRDHAGDARAAAKLAVDATKSVTTVVEQMHGAVGVTIPVITNLVYESVRGVTGVVGVGVDAAIAALAPVLGASAPGDQREALLAALNGVVGDKLASSSSSLAIPTSLRPPLDGLHRGGVLLVMVHGSSMSDRQFTREGHDHGLALADALGFTPIYAHYNSGRHVSENGRELSALLEAEAGAFSSVVVVGHSMGGLVARSAAVVAEGANALWRSKLRALVTLGTPHHGAPLERFGNIFEMILGVTKYTLPLKALAEVRSAGVTDLRFGNVVDADWQGRDRFARGADPRVITPLPSGVRCYAVAASTEKTQKESPLGDGLVPVDSALGRHADAARVLRFDDTRVIFGANHLDLLSRADVDAQLQAWLRDLS